MFDYLTKWFGSSNSRVIKQYEKIVSEINRFETQISALSDEELAKKTVEFKQQLEIGKSLDDILPEAFAVVREASNRVLGMRHFDVQLIGGITLHKGQIAEMKTGEGKTLVATAPVYLNALTGKGVHVVTVNDYLARRDGEQMGQVYRFLGLTTSVIVSGMSDEQKRDAYNADITYGTNHEFGFDYLRDNLKFHEADMVMRPFNYAVVDEIDSILIDEARTPLIISGSDNEASQMYIAADAVIKEITDEDFEKDIKTKSINLTEKGMAKVEKRLIDLGLISSPLYDPSNASMVYYINCALKANKLFTKNVDYIVKNGQVLIIDEFTGRVMEGRRYSEGLHQAIEAKEGVEVQAESQTIASISYQNLFRMYPKLSGMTGTAMTEEAEFDEIYKLKVVSIPPNKPVIRIDKEDSIYLTMQEKDKAVIALIKDCVKKSQPVLVGTTSLDRSEYISSLLTKEGIKHNVLNAKQHEREALIISEAGALGAVTIATNMAGRGTDIKLGGSIETRVNLECAGIEDPEERARKIKQITDEVNKAHDKVVKLGGLFVIGTERNESRRIDNQLRGRSGRQGDAGASKYFLSLEDDLIKRFGSPNFAKTLQKFGVKKDEDLTHRWISKAIEKAQQRVEAYNFDIRKQLLKYDDVMNEQRKMVYEQRLKLMKSNDISEYISGMIFNTLEHICELYASQDKVPYEWNIEGLSSSFKTVFDINIDGENLKNDSTMTFDLFKQHMTEQVEQKFNEIKAKIPEDFLNYIEKELALKSLDNAWKKHLLTLEHLRRGINLRAYAQKNPLNEYKLEAFNIFEEMLNSVRKEITAVMFHLNLPEPEVQENKNVYQDNSLILEETSLYDGETNEDNNEDNNDKDNVIMKEQLLPNEIVTDSSVSRNSMCSCGSGKKFKDCCGKVEGITLQPIQVSIDFENSQLENLLKNEEFINSNESIKNEELINDETLQLKDPKDIIEHFAEDQRNALLEDSISNIKTNNLPEIEKPKSVIKKAKTITKKARTVAESDTTVVKKTKRIIKKAKAIDEPNTTDIKSSKKAAESDTTNIKMDTETTDIKKVKKIAKSDTIDQKKRKITKNKIVNKDNNENTLSNKPTKRTRKRKVISNDSEN